MLSTELMYLLGEVEGSAEVVGGNLGAAPQDDPCRWYPMPMQQLTAQKERFPSQRDCRRRSEPLCPPACEEDLCSGQCTLDTGKEQEGQAPRRLRKAETILRRRTSRLLLVLEGSYDLHNKAAVCRTADCLGIQNVWMVNSRTVGDGREGRGKTVGRERRGVGEGLEDEQAAPQETPPTEAESVESRAERKADWVEERVSGREAAKRKPPRKTQRARKEAEIRMAKQAEMCAQLARLCPGEEPSYEGATASLGGSSPPSLSGKITKQAEEWLSIRQFASTAECLAALRAERYEIWATVLSQDAIELDSPSLRVPCAPTRLAIVFGSEVVGVSAQMVNAAHRRVYFPIHGFSESLNLSVSAALIMQTILQKDPSLRGCMNDMERASLR
ncbi:MAG: hypothetical protein SGPRY_004250 [Prymnesium sp.]